MKRLVRLGFLILVLFFLALIGNSYEFFELETIHLKLIPERSSFIESLFHQSIDPPSMEHVDEWEHEITLFDITIPLLEEENLRALK
ncbi:hypothetical protein PVA45_05035 [Entomospira entomophila]|uniref:Uncharacterized protein n=1 Tax=Entomospira entomophila TaxID=2719988 RepID=A0A968G943_9SPIO|nr:hypothetical protein [Entomospira entomophilus]NIZ40863.1 hypothetical protein [Entomospira entomophilus]WDI35076.1 hypothetical protein PVA45_05035 [Entomospira entomophilus]